MSCCCRKKPSAEEYTADQLEKLKLKVKIYSDQQITRFNIVRNVAYAMNELKDKKLKGTTKRDLVVAAIKQFLVAGSFPEEIVDDLVKSFIDDIFISFKKLFIRGCCRPS